MLERAQKRTARVDRVVEAARLEREEEPEIRVLRCSLPRLGCKAPGLRDRRGAPSAATLDESEGSGDHRGHQRRSDDGEQHS